MSSLDAFLTPQASQGLTIGNLVSTGSPNNTPSNATSTTAGTPVPTEERRLTVLNIPGEEPVHLDQNGIPRMVLNIRDPAAPPRPRNPMDALAQYATTWGRKLQLKNGHQEELIRASQIKDPNQQFLFIAGLILSLKDEFTLVRPADTPAVIPQYTDGHIEKLTVCSILDAAASGYKTRPSEKAIQILKNHPEWVSPALLEHKPTMKLIKVKVNSRFTHHRADIKDAISLLQVHYFLT
ncbi:hypothetical protein VKT23_020499 [Stygiomarasmius scandens]|uniref:Uncharacterized protein n=1 Tax=Marasmiellus scandens TaxID=2682957 RepID=A0ABR1IKR0_9AGAR